MQLHKLKENKVEEWKLIENEQLYDNIIFELTK
jgi:hypothetical protein